MIKTQNKMIVMVYTSTQNSKWHDKVGSQHDTHDRLRCYPHPLH
jgi:hypothetical protein